jgi:hypothetical protein
LLEAGNRWGTTCKKGNTVPAIGKQKS